MNKFYSTKDENEILHKLFRKSELSWAVSDLSKAVGPIVDLIFISLFIGPAGVTVIGYVSPLILLFELIGGNISTGSRNKVSAMLGAGKLDDANTVFSTSVLLDGTLSLMTALTVGIFCSGVSLVLGAREPQILAMTKQYIFGYIVGLPFLSLTRVLTPYLQMEGQYSRLSFISVTTTVIDIAADAFVIFVLHGGMFEIGLATAFGYIVPFFIPAAFFLQRKNKSLFRFSVKGFRLKICGEIMRIGAPSGVAKLSGALGGMLLNNMLTAAHVNTLLLRTACSLR